MAVQRATERRQPATVLLPSRARPALLVWFGLLVLLAVVVADVFVAERTLAEEGPPDLGPSGLARSALLAVGCALVTVGLGATVTQALIPIPSQPGIRSDPVARIAALGGAVIATGSALLLLGDPSLLNRMVVEDQMVEWASAALCFVAAALLLLAAIRYRRHRSEAVPVGRVTTSALLVAGAAVVAVLGLEEVSWFQRVLDIDSPDAFLNRNRQGEINFHNFATGATGNSYYVGGFLLLVGVPFLVSDRRLPRALRPVEPLIPTTAVVVAAAPAAAIVYEMWNIVWIQATFWMGLAIVLIVAARDAEYRTIATVAAASMVLTVVAYLWRGDTMIRSWDDTEVRELVIPFALALYGYSVLRQAPTGPHGGRSDPAAYFRRTPTALVPGVVRSKPSEDLMNGPSMRLIEAGPEPDRGLISVLHVSQPGSEGVGNYVADVLTAQRAMGIRVGVLCPPGSPLARAADRSGIEPVPWHASRAPSLGLRHEIDEFRRAVWAFGPTIVHLHSSKAGLVGRLALRGLIPTVFQPHAWSFEATGQPVRTLATAWERLATRWTDALVNVSDGERRLAAARSIQTTHNPVVVNPVDVDVFRPEPADDDEAARVRRSLGLGDEPIVACVGRLSHQKGQDRLLDAWSAIRAAVPNAQLLLVGDGPARATLVGRQVDDVHIPGNRTDVAEILRAVQVVVLASRWEGMSLAMLEAMATGRSVVSTDVGGVAETVALGAGSVVAQGDIRTLAAETSRRLLDPDLAEREGRRGRELMLANHTIDRTAASLTELYGALRPPVRPPAPAAALTRVLPADV